MEFNKLKRVVDKDGEVIYLNIDHIRAIHVIDFDDDDNDDKMTEIIIGNSLNDYDRTIEINLYLSPDEIYEQLTK